MPHGETEHPADQAAGAPRPDLMSMPLYVPAGCSVRPAPDRRAGLSLVVQSQLMVVFWCAWLLCCLLVAILLLPRAEAVRTVVLMAMIGQLLLWPALRLSHRQPFGAADDDSPPSRMRYARLSVLMDWFSLNLILLCVVWLFWFMVDWSIAQMGAMLALAGAWSLLIGAVIAWGRATDAGRRRTLAMALCILLTVGEPALVGLVQWLSDGLARSWPLGLSPFTTIWQVALAGKPGQALPTEALARQIAMVLIAATAGWMLLAWLSRLSRCAPHRQSTGG